jgi:hypothetical protein
VRVREATDKCKGKGRKVVLRLRSWKVVKGIQWKLSKKDKGRWLQRIFKASVEEEYQGLTVMTKYVFGCLEIRE